jgi:uncharacterized protein YecT (DUF1311 family)
MMKKIFAIVGAAAVLQGCSQVSECHSEFSQAALKEMFSEQVGAVHSSITGTPGYGDIGLLPVSDDEYDAKMVTIIQEKSETGYSCKATLEVELKKLTSEFFAESWLKPENRLGAVPMILMSQLEVKPYEASPFNESNNVIAWELWKGLEQAIVFKEYLKSPDHELFKLVGFSAGIDARTNESSSQLAISTSPIAMSPFDSTLIAELFQEEKLDDYLQAGNSLRIPVEYGISKRKIDGKESDYLEVSNNDVLSDGALLAYTMTALSHMHAKGLSNYEKVVEKYDTEEKRVELFSRSSERFPLYTSTLSCDSISPSVTYSMKGFKQDLESGALRFSDSNTFEVNGLTCKLPRDKVELVNELVLPGAALVATRAGAPSTTVSLQPATREAVVETSVAAATPAMTSAPSTSEPAPPAASNEEAAGASGPSFDCTRASTIVERLICADSDLARADRSLNEVYRAVASGQSDTSELRREMNTWRRTERDTCASAACVLSAYTSKTEALSKRVGQ